MPSSAAPRRAPNATASCMAVSPTSLPRAQSPTAPPAATDAGHCDVPLDADDVDQAHASASGTPFTTNKAVVHPPAQRPHRHPAPDSRMGKALEVRRRRLPSAHKAAPFIVVADDGSGSTAQALHGPIVTRGVNTQSRASRGAFLCSNGDWAMRGRYLGGLGLFCSSGGLSRVTDGGDSRRVGVCRWASAS